MKNLKKIICVLLTAILIFTSTISSSAAYVDENNVTGGDSFEFKEWDGVSDDTAWTFWNQSTWKISIYVAKNSDTHYSDSTVRLSDDFYKFGYTFWTYAKGTGIDTTESGGIDTDKLLVEVNNKEEYAHQNAAFSEKTYSSLKNRFFVGENYGLSGLNALPLINTGKSDTSSNNVAEYFSGNLPALRSFVAMAAKAGNIDSVDNWLNSKTFTINGITKSGWDLNAVDIRKGTNLRHTSQVAWVILYEPVFIISNTSNSGYYHALTATGIAKSTLEGKYRFTSVHTSDNGFRALFDGASMPTSKPKEWGFGLDWSALVIPNSAYLNSSWFGFMAGKNRKSITCDGVDGYWSLPQQLNGGGLGLRYTRADEYNPEVRIKKTVDGNSDGDLSGFEFLLKHNSIDVVYTFITNSKGIAKMNILPGTYTVTEKTRDGYNTAEPTQITVGEDVSTVYEFTINNTTNCKVIVNYYDKYDGKVIKENRTFVGVTNSEYDVSEMLLQNVETADKVYEYYYADGDKLLGVLDTDKVIDLYYGYDKTVTVNYLDKYTKEPIADSFVYANEYNSTYDLADKQYQNLTVEDIEYTYDSMDGDDLTGVLDDNKTINLYYGYLNNVIVKYLEVGTENILHEDNIYVAEHGQSYDMTEYTNIVIDEYVIEYLTGDDVTGVLDYDKEIIVWYSKKPVEIPASPDTDDTFKGSMVMVVGAVALMGVLMKKRKFE